MSTRTQRMYTPRIRLIQPHPSYTGIAVTDWQVVLMLYPYSEFAHVVFSGTAREAAEFIGSLPPHLLNWY